MRSMFSVVTPMIWVSPRSNSAEPCARGTTSTSADSGRMSVMPRPSMRTWSRRMRWRTSFLFSDRNAAPSSFSRPSNCGAEPGPARRALTSSSCDSRSCLPAMVSAAARSSRRGAARRPRRRRAGRPGTVGNSPRRLGGDVGQLLLGHAQAADERLGRLQPGRDDLLGGRLGAPGDELDGLGGGLGLHHHDRDVVTDDATGDDHVEHGPLQVLVLRERHPLAVDQRDADAADRAGERQARRAAWTPTRR